MQGQETKTITPGRILTLPPLSRFISEVRFGFIRSLIFDRQLLRARKSALRWQCQDAPNNTLVRNFAFPSFSPLLHFLNLFVCGFVFWASGVSAADLYSVLDFGAKGDG